MMDVDTTVPEQTRFRPLAQRGWRPHSSRFMIRGTRATIEHHPQIPPNPNIAEDDTRDQA
jgi:hypothetical protein